MSGTTIVGARGARVSSFACSLVGSWRSQRRCRQSRMALILSIERRLRRRAASKMWAIPVDAFSMWHGVAPPLLGAVRVPHHDWPFNRSDSSATLEGSKLLHRLGQSSSLRRPLGFRVIPCSRGTTQDVAVVDEKHLRMVLTAARSSRRIFLEGQACRARRRRGMGQKTRTRWGMARDLRAMAIRYAAPLALGSPNHLTEGAPRPVRSRQILACGAPAAVTKSVRCQHWLAR